MILSMQAVYNLRTTGISAINRPYYKDAWFANNPTGTFTGPGAIDWSALYVMLQPEMVEDGSFLKMNNSMFPFSPRTYKANELLKTWLLTYTINKSLSIRLTNYSIWPRYVVAVALTLVNNRILPEFHSTFLSVRPPHMTFCFHFNIILYTANAEEKRY